MSCTAWSEAEAAAREHRFRLVAILAKRTRNIAAAEDSVAEAFAAALEKWPQDGIPSDPQAWLLSVAMRKYLDGWRRATKHNELNTELALIEDELRSSDGEGFDRRLDLLFVCAHPAIDPSLHAPLMLQVVLGLSSEQIAPLWLLKPSAMAQRLVRAKSKIAASGAAFEVPPPDQRAERLEAVLSAIYAALTLTGEGASLAQEAEYLAALVVHAMPNEAEARGLLALCLYRVAGQGIDAKQRTLRAEQMLKSAAALRRPGRYQLEAAIQSAHVNQERDGRDCIDAILNLYERLVLMSPTVGARCGWAAALISAGETDRADQVILELDAVGAPYLPYWLVKARLAEVRSRPSEAQAAYEAALPLARDETTRAMLMEKMAG